MTRAALTRKYRTLLALRGTPAPARDVLRELAREFPGALRELDELPSDELEQRVAELTSVAGLRSELVAIGLFHDAVLAGRRTPAARAAGRRPSREALGQVAASLAVTVATAHRLVFPFAHVRRGL